MSSLQPQKQALSLEPSPAPQEHPLTGVKSCSTRALSHWSQVLFHKSTISLESSPAPQEHCLTGAKSCSTRALSHWSQVLLHKNTVSLEPSPAPHEHHLTGAKSCSTRTLSHWSQVLLHKNAVTLTVVHKECWNITAGLTLWFHHDRHGYGSTMTQTPWIRIYHDTNTVDQDLP
ncbi:hypothetical protein LSAT2_030011 [Lamellibrachia satsuma]|nr:hypothetical protein LSAT2_030011 [Lamellibrachia satsuma]